MEPQEPSQNGTSASKKKNRPAQRLYIPPAQRNKKQSTTKSDEDQHESIIKKKTVTEVKADVESVPNETNSLITEPICTILEDNETALQPVPAVFETEANITNDIEVEKAEQIEMRLKNLQNLKISQSKNDIDGEKEEMQRAIVNINRKSRPLIKHVSVVKNDVLHIDVVEKKPVSKLTKPKSEVSNWEDLFNDDDEIKGGNIKQVDRNEQEESVLDNDEEESLAGQNTKSMEDLDHVIEIYDFPSTFKSQDIMQLYHDIQKDATMYIRWCDDTHALLVFNSPMLAQRALNVESDVVKSRAMAQASAVAVQTATKTDLKPAMKRPATTMQTARRLITSHLGTRTKISKEEQEKERELLRKAKELKRSQRQNEKDAWDGFSRPSTA